jgi:hypothetical protein
LPVTSLSTSRQFVRIPTAAGASLLILPSICWVAIDHSVWSWDPAYYGMAAGDLWAVLTQAPRHWPETMLQVGYSKAPLISWIGQFFVPLGRLPGRAESALLIPVLLAQAGTLLLVFRTVRKFVPASPAAAAIAMLFVGGAPLFISLSHHYLTEAFQGLVVAQAFYIAASAARWSRARLFGQLLLVAAGGLLAKISTPAFCVVPCAFAAWFLVRGTGTPFRKSDLAWLAGGLAAAIGCAGWYGRNWRNAMAFAKLAATSAEAELYGSQAGVFRKAAYWVPAVGKSFFESALWWAFLAIALAALAAFAWRVNDSGRRFPPRALPMVAALQIAAVLAVLVNTVNEETRYLLALGPALAVLIAWVVAAVPGRLTALALAAVFLAQWGLVHARTLGVLGTPAGWGTPPAQESLRRHDLERLVEATCTPENEHRWIVVGVDLDWLNQYTLDFYSSLASTQNGRRCFYDYLGSLQGVGSSTAEFDAYWKNLGITRASFFVTLEQSDLPPPSDPFNRRSASISERVLRDPAFARVPFDSGSRIAIFSYRGVGR